MEQCDHNFILCRRVLSNLSVQYGNQCQTCGTWNAVKKKSLMPQEMLNAPDFDDSISIAYFEKRQEEYRKDFSASVIDRMVELREKNAKWWADYNEYLRSDKWRDKRARVLERDARICQACLKRSATQVHHKTYDHVFDEPLFDLISICDVCHDALTQMDRARRTA